VQGVQNVGHQDPSTPCRLKKEQTQKKETKINKKRENKKKNRNKGTNFCLFLPYLLVFWTKADEWFGCAQHLELRGVRTSRTKGKEKKQRIQKFVWLSSQIAPLFLALKRTPLFSGAEIRSLFSGAEKRSLFSGAEIRSLFSGAEIRSLFSGVETRRALLGTFPFLPVCSLHLPQMKLARSFTLLFVQGNSLKSTNMWFPTQRSTTVNVGGESSGADHCFPSGPYPQQLYFSLILLDKVSTLLLFYF
jgi:hypothetical protein